MHSGTCSTRRELGALVESVLASGEDVTVRFEDDVLHRRGRVVDAEPDGAVMELDRIGRGRVIVRFTWGGRPGHGLPVWLTGDLLRAAS